MDAAIRQQILDLLATHRVMTIATNRPDGWPQATTVGYVHDGLAIHFLCGLDSQKAHNLDRDDRVSITVDHDTSDLMHLTGLSLAGHATPVRDPALAARILERLAARYPDAPPIPLPMPGPDQVRIFRVDPVVVSVLDYSKGFGQAELVRC
jgi:nitroimidazol reductase NimA-like FMN-containing flavoprotein (pyridoxamine 5'-phosphate oxidase superfamily)